MLAPAPLAEALPPGLRHIEAPEPEEEGLGTCGPYIILFEVGKGVYGSVTRARHQTSGEIVAIKKLHYEADDWKDGVPSHVLREVSLLRDLSHPNIVQLKDVLEPNPRDFRLVFEFVDMDLHKVLKEYRQKETLMPMEQVRKYSFALLNGLHACHVRDIVHRDLKPQNVLIGPEGVLKIADFGLARLLSSPHRACTLDVVTLWYRAIEILLGAQGYLFEVDMWSAGCVIAEMAVGSALFPGDSEIGTIFKIFELLGTPTAEVWPEVSKLMHFKDRFPVWPDTGLAPLAKRRPELEGEGLDLLKKLLRYDRQVRLTARKAKDHPFCKLQAH